MDKPLLEIKNICKTFSIRTGEGYKDLHALSDVSMNIYSGEIVSVIGESGCGKTTLGKIVLNLLNKTSGEVFFEGEDIFSKNKQELLKFRKDAQMVFQNPFASLNPRRTVESTLLQPLKIHENLSQSEAKLRIDILLEDVGISPRYKNRYPHQFSGGQRQRINIARALAARPKFIVCDEAVSALDVSVQAQILNLLLDLKEKYNLTYLFIAHDLSTVEFLSDRICVMYLGKITEISSKEELITKQYHPYTRMLLDSHPVADPSTRKPESEHSETGVGEIPSPLNIPKGCFFSSRCPIVTDECKVTPPELKEYGSKEKPHQVACYRVQKH